MRFDHDHTEPQPPPVSAARWTHIEQGNWWGRSTRPYHTHPKQKIRGKRFLDVEWFFGFSFSMLLAFMYVWLVEDGIVSPSFFPAKTAETNSWRFRPSLVRRFSGSPRLSAAWLQGCFLQTLFSMHQNQTSTCTRWDTKRPIAFPNSQTLSQQHVNIYIFDTSTYTHCSFKRLTKMI